MRIVKNHWGWTPRGIRNWLSMWAWPVAVWGIEVTAPVMEKRVKIGPFCFSLGIVPWKPKTGTCAK